MAAWDRAPQYFCPHPVIVSPSNKNEQLVSTYRTLNICFAFATWASQLWWAENNILIL